MHSELLAKPKHSSNKLEKCWKWSQKLNFKFEICQGRDENTNPGRLGECTESLSLVGLPAELYPSEMCLYLWFVWWNSGATYLWRKQNLEQTTRIWSQNESMWKGGGGNSKESSGIRLVDETIRHFSIAIGIHSSYWHCQVTCRWKAESNSIFQKHFSQLENCQTGTDDSAMESKRAVLRRSHHRFTNPWEISFRIKSSLKKLSTSSRNLSCCGNHHLEIANRKGLESWSASQINRRCHTIFF